MQEFKQLIGGKLVDGNSGTCDVYNPATGAVLASVHKASKEQALEALDRADEAFKIWGKLSLSQREVYIRKFIAVLKENQNLAGYCLTLAILLFIYSIRKIVYSTILSVFGEMQSQCQRNSLALKRPLYNLQHKKTVSLEKSL